jgi:predicted dehydrogenase
MPTSIGVLGFAHSHVNNYCGQWRGREDLGVRVVAGWDHDSSRANTVREQHGVEICGSAEALLQRSDISGVVIAAETSMHAELAEKAVAAGKMIVMQKPMALTLDEADRIVASVEKRQAPFTMAWQMRVDPQNLKMKDLIESGALGRVLMVRRRHGLGTHFWPGFEDTWHVDPELNRDIWADDAAHAIDFIYWLLGKPKTVTAEIESMVNPKIPNDNGIAIFRYQGGPIAEVGCSFTCVAGENTTEIIGEKGVIVQNFGDAPSCNVPRPDNAVGLKWFLQETGVWTDSGIPSPSNHSERISNLAAPLAGFLNGSRGPIATAAEGRETLRMVLACYESARLGKRIDL